MGFMLFVVTVQSVLALVAVIYGGIELAKLVAAEILGPVWGA